MMEALDLNDPEMREIFDEFAAESLELLDQLEDVLDDLEEEYTAAGMEKFGQTIDRVMGAAKSIGLNEIGKYCELGKIIGYKASQINDERLIEVTVSILFDQVELIQKMIKKIQTGDENVLKNLNTEAFADRLKWLSEKFKDIKRSSCSIEEAPASAAAAPQAAASTTASAADDLGDDDFGDDDDEDWDDDDIDGLLDDLDL